MTNNDQHFQESLNSNNQPMSQPNEPNHFIGRKRKRSPSTELELKEFKQITRNRNVFSDKMEERDTRIEKSFQKNRNIKDNDDSNNIYKINNMNRNNENNDRNIHNDNNGNNHYKRIQTNKEDKEFIENKHREIKDSDNRYYEHRSFQDYRGSREGGRFDRQRSQAPVDDYHRSSRYDHDRSNSYEKHNSENSKYKKSPLNSSHRISASERAKERFKIPVDGSILWKEDTLFKEIPEHIRKALDEKLASEAEISKMMSKNIKKEKKKKKKDIIQEDEASKLLMQQFDIKQESFIGPRKSQLNQKIFQWSKDLLPGEGDAIAQFVSQNKRIPRRGEVGLTSEEIDQFEKLGYVMSGSKHKVIERVRQQKEALVMKGMVEEKERIQRGEKRLARENEVMGRFRNIVKKAAKMNP